MDRAPDIGVDSWHARFMQQARWTHATRDFLKRRLGLSKQHRILEVGCGTGVITKEFSQNVKPAHRTQIHGVDINLSFLRKANSVADNACFTCSDAYALAYSDKIFDACFCHFLLLWLKKPELALLEMRRVTKTGGTIAIFAEPFYPARIDYPLELEPLGVEQTAALLTQGADPQIGRRIAHLLNQAGCDDIFSGLIGGEWSGQIDSEFLQSEHTILRADLSERLSGQQIDNLLYLDSQAWQAGYRILYVPTFYACGRVS